LTASQTPTDPTAAARFSLSTAFSPRILLPPLVALSVVILAAIEPLAALAVAGGVCFLVAYFYRRDWLLGAVFLILIFQNLAYQRLLPINEPLALTVKRADDLLAVFFVLALAFETVFPTLRLNQIPLWRPFALMVAVCLLSAVCNHLPAKTTVVGTYVLVKNFVWFFLAASLRLDDRGFRNVLRFLMIVLGAILAFGFFQLATGDLTYQLLGLTPDYRFGIVRLRSVFTHPVYMAESMALLAILAMSCYIEFRKPAYLALAVAALAAVGLTMLVKTVLALGLAVAFLLLRKRPWLTIPFALGAIVAMVGFPEYGMESLRFQYGIYIKTPQSVRREGYRIGGEILRDSPLLGLGPGMFGGYAATLLESPTLERYGFINYDQQTYSTIESHWPHVVGEIGLVGLAVYCWLLWRADRASWRLSASPRASPHTRVLATTAAVLLFVAVIEAFAAANIEDTFCGLMIFSLLGLTQGQVLSSDSQSLPNLTRSSS